MAFFPVLCYSYTKNTALPGQYRQYTAFEGVYYMKKQKHAHSILISVVMAVYNGEAYLAQTIQSVLNQTYSRFEFLIVNDCSTDRTAEILRSFRDPRIKILNNGTNQRLARSLNKGIAAAKGKYILRLDADDICFPQRFKTQVDFMEAHPDIAMAFGNILKFTGTRIHREFDTNDYASGYIQAVLLFYNVVNHPCVILRRELFPHFTYRPEYTVTEDLALWLELGREYKFARIPRPLLLYRIHPGQVSLQQAKTQRRQEMEMKRDVLERLTGPLPEDKHLLHSRISGKKEFIPSKMLLEWLHFLLRCNQKKGLYQKDPFCQILIRMYFITGIRCRYPAKTLAAGLLSFGLGSSVRFLVRMPWRGIQAVFWYCLGKREAVKIIKQSHSLYKTEA